MSIEHSPSRETMAVGSANDPERFVDERRAAEFLNVSVRTIQRWRTDGDGPEFYKLGAKKIAYRLTGCARWAEKRAFYSTSQVDATS